MCLSEINLMEKAQALKKRSFRVFFIFFLLCILPVAILSQDNLPSDEFLYDVTTLGTEFWVAIPQNEDQAGNLKNIGLEILVTSFKKTTVNLEIPSVGKIITKSVEPFVTQIFSTKTNDFGFEMEVTESEVVTYKGIKISSPDPISVYVINVKQYSGEGYLAVPTKAWGSEYYHCSYFDFYQNNLERGGGFIIVASEDGTKVTVNIKGVGAAYGKTVAGKNIGDNVTVTLNAGQTYMMRGNGKSLGFFDITGSQITANKPVGVISFHMRTMIPPIGPDDRDNLSEMLLPSSAWGKNFVSLEFDRTPKGSRKGKGDLFRIVNHQLDTKVKVDWYDKSSNVKLGQDNANLYNIGEFRELQPVSSISGSSNTKTSVYGVSVWSSDKPIQLMQYAFSSQWDGDERWSPLNIVLSPNEQYVSNTVFQTPSETGFNENIVNMFIVGDPNDPEKAMLKSVKFDGVEVYKKDTRMLENIIPGTNIYWASFNIDKGAHYITSNTKFTGFVNGFSSLNCYGWPIAAGAKRINGYDKMPPRISINDSCGIFTAIATETRNGETSGDPKQQDEGIYSIFLLSKKSENFQLLIDNPSAFKPQLKITSQKFILRPLDKMKPGKAYFAVTDRAGNFIEDSIMFYPQKIKFSKTNLDFGKSRTGQDKIIQFPVTNEGDSPLSVLDIKLQKGTMFSIDGEIFKGSIAPNETIQIPVKFNPTTETPEERDSLIIYFNCDEFKFSLIGSGVAPKIQLFDVNFDSVEVNKEVCLGSLNKNGFKIENIGSDTMLVTAIENVTPPFYLDNLSPQLPLSIPPKSSAYINSFCFISAVAGEFENEISIASDAQSGKPTSKLRAKAFDKKDTTGLNNNFDYNGVSFEINPMPITEDGFKIYVNGNLDGKKPIIEILDLQGNKVISELYSITENIFGIELTNALTGLYLVKITINNSIYHLKAVVIK